VRNIREDKGYTYSPGSSLSVYEKGGVHETQADVRTEVTGAALAEIFYEMDRMATTDVTDEELSRGKRAEGGLYLLRNQSQGAVANLLAQAWVRGLPPAALAEYVPKLNAVTKADVRRVARTYLPSARQTIVVVGEAAKVQEELAVFGAVERVTR
jgi:zinc protease